MKIEYQINENNNNSVKIMTIHASKGLEFNVCYFSGLYSGFNIREATSKFSYDEKYGIIIPYKKDFVYNTIYHHLSYKNYVIENISERIRLFYVALTRAKEKMIFLLPQNKKDEIISINDIVDDETRSKYNSFSSIMYSLEDKTKSYYNNISLDDIELTKDYNRIKNNNYEKDLIKINDKIIVEDINIDIKIEKEKSFSKKGNKLITVEEQRKLDYGTRMHELLELTDFNNPNYELLRDSEKKVINNFIKKIDLNNCNIYKEYEFIYNENNNVYHGIIDLMLEYKDNIKIIDYKLKNIFDDEYINQLNGYKKYIEDIFNKPTEIYLYSILNDTLNKI